MKRYCLANKRIKKVYSNIRSERMLERLYPDISNAKQYHFNIFKRRDS